ncbi:hypothetical protein [Loktanella fryxellensis]|uniref:hypothetical protein n=1 Tax=Loktanella fryxellensis TaxID=245187 RepID=UPI000AED52EB|nr:hypothetical protein [Loktanella fryxellensis]
MDLPVPPQAALIARYRHLKQVTLPSLAEVRRWPVRHDHCFQRIVLDTICGGVWYDRIARPAYRHLTAAEACSAIALCEAIIADHVDLAELNTRSLIWRSTRAAHPRANPQTRGR